MPRLVFSGIPTRLPTLRYQEVALTSRQAYLLQPQGPESRLVTVPVLSFDSQPFPVVESILGSSDLVKENLVSVVEDSGKIVHYVVYHHGQSNSAFVNNAILAAFGADCVWQGQILIMKFLPGPVFVDVPTTDSKEYCLYDVLKRFLSDCTGLAIPDPLQPLTTARTAETNGDDGSGTSRSGGQSNIDSDDCMHLSPAFESAEDLDTLGLTAFAKLDLAGDNDGSSSPLSADLNQNAAGSVYGGFESVPYPSDNEGDGQGDASAGSHFEGMLLYPFDDSDVVDHGTSKRGVEDVEDPSSPPPATRPRL